ncbi:TIGR04255 family protein [Pseudomonas sp. MCal1]|uniref:TIGR04255 family protein n=1 Tax=Pseudomonas sp. MCal1 TaxID=2919887 RepID=UPI00224DA665|nr:TIGR04255 family protein [Pseudomonas sp. MCal1]MCX4218725.1 TIGR04255 family protein [Pseudomonas sp. MCal1]
MKERFESPPLVELVAELRWSPDVGDESHGPMLHPQASAAYEEFFAHLLTELSRQGYGASERMIPVGFPLIQQHPVIRYKKNVQPTSTDDKTASTLFQAGVGIFTINAVQPYKSWEQFRPVVQIGLAALILSKPKMVGGFSLTLRYIDAFKGDLIDGMTHRGFLESALGIKVNVPDALKKLSVDGSTVVPMLHLVTPLDFGTLQIQFAEGEISGERVFLMENVVTVSEPSAGDVEILLKGFDAARDVVHQSFVEMTAPIHHKMRLLREQ